ncbi:hypothetical protein [Mesorhizobium sp.]|uniref:hypothetical protein n=1 Tax=Mesorhizobium sp. TaxID=1871066 RepID=UPI00120FEAB3|nr:hypothetical protein [Mesorhizobium sp.]TIL43287.1 MAG: hypothetical protein E5Y86_22865 [Mesorhizobium sp.]
MWTDRQPAYHNRLHIERVPAQTIALLVDYGVPPAALGVDRLFEQRYLQWSGTGPVCLNGAASANVSRPGLERALFGLAESCGVKFCIGAVPYAAIADPARLLFDATGRAGVTAARRWRPANPVVSRTFQFTASPAPHHATLALAAGSEGYAYRLGNRHGLCLGVVGGRDLIRGQWPEIRERIVRFAPWIVSGLPGADGQAGRAGACSLQWADAGPRAILIGDAAIARDALSSQGLAMGLGAALHAVSKAVIGSTPGPQRNGPVQRAEHARRVLAMISAAAFGSQPLWKEYGGFLQKAAMKLA